MVRAPACHAGGRRFEPDPGRRRFRESENDLYASVAQSVEQGTENPRVIGSIPIGGTIFLYVLRKEHTLCGRSSSGRAPPCQGGGSEFEPRRPLHFCGSLAQLGEHLPYKQRVSGSSPLTSTKCGPVVQLVRTLACHARGRQFEPDSGRHMLL